MLFIGSCGRVSAIDPATGRIHWTTALNSDGVLGGRVGVDVCLLEDDGTLYAGCNGHLFALDAQSGKVLWHNELEGFGHHPVTLAMHGKSVQVLTRTEHRHT